MGKRQGRQHQNTITGLSKVHKMGGPSGGGQNTHINEKNTSRHLLSRDSHNQRYGKMICGNREQKRNGS